MPRLTRVGWHRVSWNDRRRLVLFRLAATGLALVILPRLGADRFVVINTSPSVAPGLYMRSWEQPAVGELVDFSIPARARDYVRQRTGNDGRSWYILKPIAGGPGDHIDTTGTWLVINRRRIAPMPPQTDRSGSPLPLWKESRILGVHEFFVFSDRIPNSFDSRCYGPIMRGEIDSVRTALLTW